MEKMDLLIQEAILLDTGNLKACGKMLTLLDAFDHPAIEQDTRLLRGYLEAIIMSDIEGECPDLNTVIEVVETMQQHLRSALEGGNPPPAPVSRPDIPDVPQAVPEAPKAAEPAGGMEILSEDTGLIRDFIAEAREHLQEIEINMVEWEKSPEDREIINSIFRPFHTIKGVTGFLNLQEINHLSHQLENMLDDARDGKTRLGPEISDLIFDGVDTLRRMLASLELAIHDQAPVRYDVDLEGIHHRLERFISGNNSPAPEPPAVALPETVPESKGGKRLGDILVSEGKIDGEALRQTLRKQAVESPSKPLGELLIEENMVSPRDVRDAIRKQADSGRVAVEKYLKVDTVKMDQLLDMVGELVISQSLVTHNAEVKRITDPLFLRDIAQLTRVTASLQNISMSMRLVPIGATFQKMSRIVRDIARKTGKKIALNIEGQSAEIDRNMVEELYDPLVHMIRNACDHGIGTPAERTAKGKPEEGVVLLKAEHAGGRVVITIRDDGSGLNREAILAKAIDRGLVQPDEELEDKDVLNLIFLPGFSTARQVTDISGRGVGMDVVKQALEKLRGTVEIASEPGLGTTFTIKLPLTTAIIDGMMVQVGRERYIIPTLSVKRLIRPERADLSTVVGKGELVHIKDRLLPLVRLDRALGVEGARTDPSEAVLIVVEDGQREVALQVDALLGKQEVVIKSLGDKFRNLPGVAGGAILGDGRIGLILDIRAIVNHSESLDRESHGIGRPRAVRE